MYEDYNNYNLNNSGEYNSEGYSFDQEPTEPTPQEPKSKRTGGNKNVKRVAKKIGAITLSAVLFGGVAAGTFQAVNGVSGYNTSSGKVAADTADTTTASKSSLIKTNSSADSTGSTSHTGSLDVSGIATEAMPSIVAITNKSVQEVQDYFSMFGYGGQTQQQEAESRGSGIIIGKNDTELLIVTNAHVIEGADTLTVSFVDNQAVEANLKGSDTDEDLAVIAVPIDKISDDTLSKISVATLGSSDSLKVGEQVVAIGNALGYGQSVTTGIVSATNRTLGDSETDENGQPIDAAQQTDTSTTKEPTYIQTDAAINPGNSGGALLNMDGQVIGINSAKLASTEIEGMGYAIPVDRVSTLIEDLMNQTTKSKVSASEKGALDIQGISVTSDVSQAYNIPEGVYVMDVTSGGAADKAGIKQYDVITKFDGKKVSDITVLQETLSYYKTGDTVKVTYQKSGENGYTEQTVEVTLGKAETVDSSNSGSQSQDNGNGSSLFDDFFGGRQGNGSADSQLTSWSSDYDC